MQLKTFYFNDLRECTYILWDDTCECVIVDPGCYSESEKSRLEKFVLENSLKPVMLLNTHGHFDHIMGNAFVSQKWNVKTYIHPDDKPHLERAVQYSNMFGYNVEAPSLDTVDLNDGDELKFGNSLLKVMTTPGHTRGGVSFYSETDKFVITGDALFAGSIGRTDLPGGDYDQLMESLLGKIIKLGDDYSVYPGHGPATTIANEKNTNPFLRYE
ncbi:MAG: MBL fold hydrolase [Bacteroidetes bacterium HGW-Bacteroidetes-7]|jgi:glyoxylase-like metal-dependent hydrolase (beta-lactamase superfamily II)|nr:MAG: MBL fold hydrolase [Bacteroidetes bacterium HGW-Bacteroidetes-7]